MPDEFQGNFELHISRFSLFIIASSSSFSLKLTESLTFPSTITHMSWTPYLEASDELVDFICISTKSLNFDVTRPTLSIKGAKSQTQEPKGTKTSIFTFSFLIFTNLPTHMQS